MRTVVTVGGLATTGPVSVGGLSFPAPTVAWSVRGSEPRPGEDPRWPVVVAEGPSAPLGSRTLQLISGGQSLQLQTSVLAPEVSGVPGDAQAAAPEAWVVHWPLEASQWETLRAARPGLIVLGNARVLLGEGESFVLAVRDLRERLGAAPILWAPRVALPHRLAWLTYLGVDLLDATEARLRAQRGVYLDETLGELEREAAVARCSCPHCVGVDPNLDRHVRWVFERESALVRAATQSHRLRELVEARLTAEPALAELLRYTDSHLGDLLEDRTPVVGTGQRNYVLRESQRRPEVGRYLRRLVERYRPPPAKEVLLVLPCSKTKPYRNSPSHRRYWKALEGIAGLERVHVVSVTSPLGVVPRELEDVYPARHYDIPVTGEWDESERAGVLRGVRHLLANGRYGAAVFHLDPEEYGFLREAAPPNLPTVWSSGDHRTLAGAALDAMRRAVGDAVAETRPVAGGPLAVVREELHEVAAFQFGRGPADLLFADPVRLMGRPWFQRLTDGKHTDLATWREERGLFQLTTAGGARMLPAGGYAVDVAPGLELAGDLFTPGVAGVSPEVRAGDAVLLVRDGRLLGVGEAELSARLMRQLPRGRAVSVRHRVHQSPPNHRHAQDSEQSPTGGPVV